MEKVLGLLAQVTHQALPLIWKSRPSLLVLTLDQVEYNLGSPHKWHQVHFPWKTEGRDRSSCLCCSCHSSTYQPKTFMRIYLLNIHIWIWYNKKVTLKIAKRHVNFQGSVFQTYPIHKVALFFRVRQFPWDDFKQ